MSEDVLALLDVPVLAARFDITEEGLRYLRQWVNESGIRWGIDDDNVRELGTPRHRTTHLAIWPDAYVAGLRDGERAGRVAIGSTL
ncbi:hypothetical protein ACLK15_16325 [Escherichia coli]